MYSSGSDLSAPFKFVWLDVIGSLFKSLREGVADKASKASFTDLVRELIVPSRRSRRLSMLVFVSLSQASIT